VNSKLTVNVGLRYEYSPWLKRIQGSAWYVRSNAGEADHRGEQYKSGRPERLSMLLLPHINSSDNYIQTSTQAGLPYSITYTDSHAVRSTRRLCLAGLGNGTVIRGGFGIFYEPEGTSGRVKPQYSSLPAVGDSQPDAECRSKRARLPISF